VEELYFIFPVVGIEATVSSNARHSTSQPLPRPKDFKKQTSIKQLLLSFPWKYNVARVVSVKDLLFLISKICEEKVNCQIQQNQLIE
jgi:hypothetical protein